MSGAARIAKERRRQVSDEGWTAEHDDEHDGFQLTRAAVVYALNAHSIAVGHSPSIIESGIVWPWDGTSWNPMSDPAGLLVKAGALLAAEIDRLERSAPEPATTATAEAVGEGLLELTHLVTMAAQVRQLREAIRLTRENIGERALPAVPGWSWYDAVEATGGFEGFGLCASVLDPHRFGRPRPGVLFYCGRAAGHDGNHGLPPDDQPRRCSPAVPCAKPNQKHIDEFGECFVAGYDRYVSLGGTPQEGDRVWLDQDASGQL